LRRGKEIAYEAIVICNLLHIHSVSLATTKRLGRHHDEGIQPVECEAKQMEVKAWLERAIIEGMDTVLNGTDDECVPVEIEARIATRTVTPAGAIDSRTRKARTALGSSH